MPPCARPVHHHPHHTQMPPDGDSRQGARPEGTAILMATTQPTTQHIAERCGYPWPPTDRRTHRARTVGWQALTVSAIYMQCGLPRPVADGHGGRHRAAEPNDVTAPISVFGLTPGPHAIWQFA